MTRARETPSLRASSAHEKGIVHRDIKSANIMVTPKAQVMYLFKGDYTKAQSCFEKLSAASDKDAKGTTGFSRERCRKTIGEAV